MKKISLFLLTTLMVTSAYSGGPESDGGDALSDDDFELLLSKGVFGGEGAKGPDGSDGDENASVVVLDPEALRAAGGEEVVAPAEEVRDGAVVSSEKLLFNICEFFGTVREGAQATIQGARNRLQKVPKVKCSCVQNKMGQFKKEGKEAVEELILEAKSWFDALQIRHDEALDKRKPKEAAEGADVAELRSKLAARDELLAKQEAQLAEIQAKFE